MGWPCRGRVLRNASLSCRSYSTNSCTYHYACKLLVVGGGTGGCSIASRFAKKLRNNDIIVLEPSQRKVRDLTNITYITGGKSLFGVDKYARALYKVAADRGVAVNCCIDLLEVGCRTAVFQDMEGGRIVLPYNLLHVTPPMSAPLSLRQCPDLVTEQGFLDVDHHSLRHKRYSNIFGVGDCLATPNSKTAAAVARQSYVVERNLYSVMAGETPTARYDGYGACPLLTSYKRGILAEFLYDKRPHETFPFDQSKERRILYHLQTSILPYVYWNKLLKGTWNGPAGLRRIINPMAKK
ncbi:hypothetical protein evm_005770 [Chilo suppressalis]|nr:hypothetical protein evm_005770 [Chilo suppressalis]